MPRPKKSNRSDGRYEIRRVIARDANNNPISKSFYGKNKDEALKKYADYMEDAERREKEKERMDFSSWVEKWLYVYKEPDVKPTTFVTTYERPCKNYILPYFKDRVLQEITQLEIKAFLNTLTEKSQSLIDKIVICLRGIFESAIDNDLIGKNPCRNISIKSKAEKKAKRTYDRNTADRLCAVNHPYTLFVHILLRMGLRCSELCGLRWEDINFATGTMSITQALTAESGRVFIDEPKSKNSKRTLPIPEDLLQRLSQSKSEGYIAMNGKRHMTPEHFNERQLEVFYNFLDIPRELRLTAHELRHTCGTLLYDETKDIYHVSRFLGHSDIGITTKIYVHSEMQEEKIHVDFAVPKKATNF